MIIKSFKKYVDRIKFFRSMFDYEIKRNYFYNSFNLTIAQNLHVYKVFQMIVIDQNFNKINTMFQIMSLMFETHHNR